MAQEHIENVSVDPAEEVDRTVCDCLYKLLPTLKPEYAELIWRADLLGEPRDRIAASLGTTLSNVAVRLYRGRQALKKRLDESVFDLPCPRLPRLPLRGSATDQEPAGHCARLEPNTQPRRAVPLDMFRRRPSTNYTINLGT